MAAMLLAGAGCGGGGNDSTQATASAEVPACLPGSAWNGSACIAFALRAVERLPTGRVVSGQPETLELIIYRPLQAPPAGQPGPALVFHHGSTGDGSDPALFRLSFDSQSIAREFTSRGLIVFYAQRRGRGQSEGLYDEGFEPDRSRYSCQQGPARQGLERALEDADTITRVLRIRSDLDPARLLVGGVSRGGLLALAHAARTPGSYRGVINFVGGWLGEACVDAAALHRVAATESAGGPESLWLYGENDPFYSLTHSRANFDTYIAAGGRGIWWVGRRSDPTASGHLIHAEPALWQATLSSYLQRVMP